jgi:long-subunit fatty acid transport protein
MKKLLISIILFSSPAFAAFSNYNSILIGDLVAGMGGAGTAVVGDVAASPFYNPATLGMLSANAFSAAVGVYKKFDILYGEEEDLTKAPLRVSQGYFRSIPSSTGSAIQIKDSVIALSIIVPDYETFKGDLYNKGENITTLSFTDESLWAGLSFGHQISENEGVGVSVYYTARNFTRSVNDRSFSGANDNTIFYSERNKQDNNIVTIFGYFRRLNDQWATGFSFRPRSLTVASKLSVYETTTTTTGGTVSQDTINKPQQDSEAVIPGRLAWGLTYEPNETFLFSGDLTFHEGVTYEEASIPVISMEIDHKPTWNVALGMQAKLKDWLKVRTGLYTDMSSHPDPKTINRYQEDHVDMYGFSANLDFVAGNKIGYTFGGYYTGGKGLSRQRLNQNFETVTKTEHIFTMLLGTSFYF